MLEAIPEYAGLDFSELTPDWMSKKDFYAATVPALQARARWCRKWLRSLPEREIVVVAHGDILRYMTEAYDMLVEGVPPAMIENAAKFAGMPVGPLALNDETAVDLSHRIMKATMRDEGEAAVDPRHFQLVESMVTEEGRLGRKAGKGFYDYEDGKRTGLWPGLREAFPPVDDPSSISLLDLQERMLFIEVIETVKCLDEGVIETVADANIGSIMGIGYPGWSGGVLQYANGYEGGLAGFVERARELASQYGERFEPPASLVEKAEAGETYLDKDKSLTPA